MAGTVLPVTIAELQAALDEADPPTPDDVSITVDGRRLDTKGKVLAFLADLDAEREAARRRHADLDAGAG